MNYVLDCPSCGQQLTPHAGNPESAPWLCNNCHLAFWTCELQPGTRAHYRPEHRDWGYGPHMKELELQRVIELEHARKRGTSAREDQLAILTLTQLQHLKTRKKVDPEFMKLVTAEHGRRGAK